MTASKRKDLALREYRTTIFINYESYSLLVLKAPIVTINDNNSIITSYFISRTPFFIRIPFQFVEEVTTILPGAQGH